MARPTFVTLLATAVFSATLCGQEKPKSGSENDPIAAGLAKGKQEFEAAAERAKAGLMTAFDAAEKRALANTKLGAEERVTLLDRLRVERQAFETDDTLPESPGVKSAVGEYRRELATARRKCEKAFDEAADKYLKQKNLSAAKAVLADKAEYFPMPQEAAKDGRQLWRFAREFGGGYFKRQADGSWVEIGKDGARIGTWVELRRTAEYVELEDRTRGYATRLGTDKAWLANPRGGQFGPSPGGDWER